MSPPSEQPTRARDASPELVELSGVVLQGRYELGTVLGSGGMGMVFQAKDLRLGRDVAVKVMRPAFARDGGFVQRFLREAQAASKIRHRNVVVLLDYGETPDKSGASGGREASSGAAGGLVYSVMELLEGDDLEALLRRRPDRRMEWGEALELLAQIASGLHAAHLQGVIHRDIKPANCLVTTEDDQPVVKLLDFGIAKLEDDGAHTQQLTGTGDVLGTPSYVAPELVRTQNRGSPQSDVYSLGVVAYRMLTGHVPFTGETAFEVMRRACSERVPSMRERVPSLPRAVEDFVLSMLAKDPAERPADMQVVRQRLQALSREVPRSRGEGSLGEAMFRKLTAELPRIQGNALQLLSQHITPRASSRDEAAAAIPKAVEKMLGAMTKPRDEGLTSIGGIDRALRRSTRGAVRVLGEVQAVLQAGTRPVDADETIATPSREDAAEHLQTTAAIGSSQAHDADAVGAADEETIALDGSLGGQEERARQLDETLALAGSDGSSSQDESAPSVATGDDDVLPAKPAGAAKPEGAADPPPPTDEDDAATSSGDDAAPRDGHASQGAVLPTDDAPDRSRRSSWRWVLLVAGLVAAGSLAFAMLGT